MEKTIKQIADELKVSKETVRKRAKTLPTSCRQVGAKGEILINDEGLKILKESLKKTDNHTDNQSANIGANVGTTEKYIKSLEEQIEYLKKQIEIKDEQIAQWSASATTIKLLAEQKPLAIETVEEEPKKKKWLFW